MWIVFLVIGVLALAFGVDQFGKMKAREMADHQEKLQRELAEKQENCWQAHKKELSDILDEHQAILLRKFRQSICKDDYGNTVLDRWNMERNYFIDNVVLRECPSMLEVLGRKDVEDSIEGRVLYTLHTPNENYLSVDAMSGKEFEQYCEGILKEAGWVTRMTKATGDQGVDIVGTRNGICVVFQCKKYSSSVGNAAVQEVFAGQIFEGAQVAAVVTNSSYTKAARELAHSAGVYLLHFDELSSFVPESYSSHS